MISQTVKLSNLINNLPFDADILPTSACLVGGAVRDALLHRERSYLDLDFVVVANAIEIARKIANDYQAGFVVLDESREIARVVFHPRPSPLFPLAGRADLVVMDAHAGIHGPPFLRG